MQKTRIFPDGSRCPRLRHKGVWVAHMSNQKTITELSSFLGQRLSLSKPDLAQHGTSETHFPITPPDAIAYPYNTEEVSQIVKICASNRCPIVGWGAGTSLEGQAQAINGGISVDFLHMNQVLEVNEEEQWVRVQPGLVRDVLNEHLKSYRLHFAPDPATSSRANVGGMVGNNSSGTKSILYGKTVDHVLEAQVLLADGTGLCLKELNPEEYQKKITQEDREGEVYQRFQKIVENNEGEVEQRFPKVMRRVGGYNLDEFTNTDHWNLSKLVCGSEGTLATTLELKLNLEPLPTFKSVCVVHFAKVLELFRR